MKSNNFPKNRNINILIISHYLHKALDNGSGAPHNIRNYFLDKSHIILYIEHPFPNSNYPRSQFAIYKKGKKQEIFDTSNYQLPQLLMYGYQFFLNWFFILKNIKKYDICFALDNLSVISVVLFRKIGLIKKVIYYSVDYTPNRFSNRLFNKLFHLSDRLASKLSDCNWVTVKNIIKAKNDNGLDVPISSKFVIVPIGFDQSFLNIKNKINKDNHHFIFVGSLVKKQGLQLVINSFPKLIEFWPDAKLTIIGAGDYLKSLKKLSKELKLTSKVKFLGFIDDYKKIMELLSKASIGIATYDPEIANFSYFADPSKIKQYLICGLPVITTNVAPIAKTIKRYHLGKVIDYNESSFIKAALEIEGNPTTFKAYQKNAVKHSVNFEINRILTKALINTT